MDHLQKNIPISFHSLLADIRNAQEHLSVHRQQIANAQNGFLLEYRISGEILPGGFFITPGTKTFIQLGMEDI